MVSAFSHCQWGDLGLFKGLASKGHHNSPSLSPCTLLRKKKKVEVTIKKKGSWFELKIGLALLEVMY